MVSKKYSCAISNPSSRSPSDKCMRQDTDPRGNIFKSLRTMINCIHGSHIGQQGLGRADIGSRFFSFDMLFPGLKGHSQCPVTLGIHTHTDDSSGNGSFKIISGCKKSGMRTAKSNRYTKTLRRSDGTSAPSSPGGVKQGECKQIGGHYYKSTGCLNLSDKGAVIRNISLSIRILYDGTEISFINTCALHNHH